MTPVRRQPTRSGTGARHTAINALHTTLRNRTLRVDSTAVTAQRLKRLNSILRKLRRRETIQMSQMQDVGGCRAVVSNLSRLTALRRVYESSPLRHNLARIRDYIHDPEDDGYRSVHLMCRFSGKGTALPWNKLRIEIQMRTSLQHDKKPISIRRPSAPGQGSLF
jgi:ppGpp synthetase/RelA/SpoT-type nucleotidyltranferase